MQSATPGKPLDLEHSLLTSRERDAIPRGVYDKLKADGIAFEALGPERLWHELSRIWPDDRSHLALTEVAEWFAKFTYLPKLRDRLVLEGAIRAAVARAKHAPDHVALPTVGNRGRSAGRICG